MSVVLLSAVRTPLGSLGGGLRSLGAVQLGALAIREAVTCSGAARSSVSEVMMGCAFQAGLGPNPARQAALEAGLPESVSAWTLNQLCGSSWMAVIQAARSLASEPKGVIVAGGLESVSNAPYLLPAARWGRRMGATELRDPLLQDGPKWFARIDAARKVPSSEEQSGGALGRIPVAVKNRKDTLRMDLDECGPNLSLAEAPPADGAAALVLASETGAESQRPLGRILGFSTSGEGAPKLAARAGLPLQEVHNPVAPDHLLALGGAPLLVDLLHAPRESSQRFPFITIKTGDGQTLSLLLELF